EDLQLIVSELGIDTDYSAAYTVNAATWDSTVRIQLTDRRSLSSQEYASLLRREIESDSRFTDMRFCFNTGGMIQSTLNFGSPTPIAGRIKGGQRTEQWSAARLLRARL